MELAAETFEVDRAGREKDAIDGRFWIFGTVFRTDFCGGSTASCFADKDNCEVSFLKTGNLEGLGRPDGLFTGVICCSDSIAVTSLLIQPEASRIALVRSSALISSSLSA